MPAPVSVGADFTCRVARQIHSEGERGQGFVGQALFFKGSVGYPPGFVSDHGNFGKLSFFAPPVHLFEVLVGLGLFGPRVGEKDEVRAHASTAHLDEHGC